MSLAALALVSLSSSSHRASWTRNFQKCTTLVLLTCRRSLQLLARRSKRAAAPARSEPQVHPPFTLQLPCTHDARERKLTHAWFAAIEEVMSVKSIREQDGKAFCFTGTNAVQNLQQGQQRGAGSRYP